jgi:hypothetical protein
MTSDETKVLSLDGLQHFATKMKSWIGDHYVAKESGKDLSLPSASGPMFSHQYGENAMFSRKEIV